VSALAAGLILCMAVIAPFPIAWLIGDRRAQR